MPITPLFTQPWGILANKKEAKLTGGAITRGATVRPALRSRYNAHGDSAAISTPISMGYVEAVLGVMLGIVGTISYDAGAHKGRVSMRSTGGAIAYDFSWKVESDSRIVFGGFSHSDGQPTYQAAIVGLTQLIALHRCGAPAQTDEVVNRWYTLVDVMEAAYPRANQDAGWPGKTLAEAAANPSILMRIESVCDTLYHAMPYHLPTLAKGVVVPHLNERGLVVTAPDVLAKGEGRATSLPGNILINPTIGHAEIVDRRAPTPATAAPSGAAGECSASSSTKTTAAPIGAISIASTASEAGAPASAAVTDDPAKAADAAKAAEWAVNPARPGAPDPTPPSPLPTPKLYGSHLARVRRAIATSQGPLMLVGPTSTGKTTLAVFAGRDLDWGTEIMVCDPGMDDKELFGGYARTITPTSLASVMVEAEEADSGADKAAATKAPRLPAWAQTLMDQTNGLLVTAEARLAEVQRKLEALDACSDNGEWEAIDGPIARWARRAAAGERVLLIIDELARGHESLISAVMRVMNTYDRDTVERQGLAVPAGAEISTTFHVIDLWHTRERLVIPADRVKIIATANIGDRYTGLDLADPAFRRRWSGGWLYLGAYQPDTVGEILADKLGIPATATLIVKMKVVAMQVEEYQRKEDQLLATLDLATLVTWGQTVIAMAAMPGMGVAKAWAEAASDVWIERICPMKGAELNPDVRTQLVRFVSSNTPASIR